MKEDGGHQKGRLQPGHGTSPPHNFALNTYNIKFENSTSLSWKVIGLGFSIAFIRPQQQPGWYWGSDDNDNNFIRTKPTTRTQCPTLLQKMARVLSFATLCERTFYGMIHQTTYLPTSRWFSWVFYEKSEKVANCDCIVISLLVSFLDLTGAVFTLFKSNYKLANDSLDKRVKI